MGKKKRGRAPDIGFKVGGEDISPDERGRLKGKPKKSNFKNVKKKKQKKESDPFLQD